MSEMNLSKPAFQPSELPFVSIVIPSHNRCKQLARALLHVAAVDYPPEKMEVIVVLDGCTDDSAAMLSKRQWSSAFNLWVLEQAQGGPSAARNAGVKEAKGEYILFIDDDVMVTPQILNEHWRMLKENPETVSVGPMLRPEDSRGPVWVRWEEYILEKQYQELLQGKYQFTPRQFYTGNCFLKREWLLQAGLFDESFKRYEDVAFAYTLQQMELKFKFNPTAAGYHYPRRSFQSWIKMHYLYGIYAVRLDRDKQLINMIDITRKEFAKRNIATRFLADKFLNHKTLQGVLAQISVIIAQLLSLAKLKQQGYQLLSAVANVLFWQGFNEELNLAKSELSNNYLSEKDQNKEKENPPISVVISTRNRKNDIVPVIKSVLSNNYPSFDLHIIDQSDNDFTEKAVKPFLNDTRFFYKRSNSIGVSKGRNIGISDCTNDLIAITDDDCVVPKTWLNEMVGAFQVNSNIGMVFGNVFTGLHNPKAGFIPSYKCKKPLLIKNLKQKIRSRGIGACMGVRRSIWEKVFYFDEMLGPGSQFMSAEENDLAAKVLLAGYFIYETPKVYLTHNGFRTWQEGRILSQRSWYGIGAALAKNAREMPFHTFLYVGYEWGYIALGTFFQRILLKQKISSVTPVIFFWKGFIRGLFTSIDPFTGNYTKNESYDEVRGFISVQSLEKKGEQKT